MCFPARASAGLQIWPAAALREAGGAIPIASLHLHSKMRGAQPFAPPLAANAHAPAPLGVQVVWFTAKNSNHCLFAPLGGGTVRYLFVGLGCTGEVAARSSAERSSAVPRRGALCSFWGGRDGSHAHRRLLWLGRHWPGGGKGHVPCALRC